MDKLQSALKYAKLGYSVLPMNGKHPLIKFADRPALTTDQIKKCWSKYPNANIALRTTNFFVVDIDTKKAHGKDGMKSIKQLPSGVILPTRTQKTASGGYQMFYMKPPDSHLTQAIGLLPGVDIKAHPNNYVLVPPSTTEKGYYRWLNDGAQMKHPSALLLEMIANYQPQSTRKPQQGSYYPGKKWTGRVLDNIVKGAPEGQRNDYLTRLCGQMIYAGADSETVWTLINYANQFNTPPLEDREVGKIVASVLKEVEKVSKKRQALDTSNPAVKGLGLNALFQDLDDKNKKSPAVPKWAIKGKHGVYTTPPLLGQYILDNNRFIYFQHGKSIDLYSYDSKLGLWQLITKQQIDKQVTNQLNLINDWSSRKMHDTTTFVLSSIDTLNASYTIDDVVDVDKVHFKNGVYSFTEDKMLPHSPNYYFSRGRNYSLKPAEQPTPNTDQWLIESVGEDGYTLLMQYIGYLFYRSNETWQAFIILLANGGDGKSTFFNWLDELIGDDNTSTVSLENLAIDNNKFALSRLVGMSLNYDADITNALIKKPDKLKKISGNDRIDVEEKGKDAFKVKLFTKLMFAANDLPAFKDNSGGFKRRAIIIPFNKIPNFRERFNLKAIYREIPKFAYKCMRAFWEAHNQEYIKTSPAMDKLSDEWSGANNHVIEFVDDYCTIEEDAREKKVYVYKAYRSFCLASGYKPLSSVQFRKELERLDTKPKIYDTTAKINGKAYKSYINLKLRGATVTKLLDSYR